MTRTRIERAFAFVVALVAASACSQPPARDEALPGVGNFAKVSPSLWRGSQPTAEGFRQLEAAGVKTVVNLRADHDDAPLLKGTRLAPIRIPARPWHVEEDDLVAFLRVVEDPAHGTVFVHCAQGEDRTGYCVAAYRMVVDGWSADRAIAEMEDFHANPVWLANERALRNLDVERVKRRVAER